MNVVTIVGARPQFIKAAMVSRCLRRHLEEYVVHTGQHYDDLMSDVFFRELCDWLPNTNLKAGSGSHGAQTALMLGAIESVLIARHPDAVIVYGDTNSTLSGALAAAKLRIPVIHVESGLRSFNREMPEEVNRVVTDHLSKLLLCPSQTAICNLAREGIVDNVVWVGDVMADAVAWASGNASRLTDKGWYQQVNGRSFGLLTLHRAENTDDVSRLEAIIVGIGAIKLPIVFPIHPRTKKSLASAGIQLPGNVIPLEPLGYVDMIALESRAGLVMTDSGGIQKEAYWLGVPCVTLRDETEWVETIHSGRNVLAGADCGKIVACANEQFAKGCIEPSRDSAIHSDLYGDSRAAERCTNAIVKCLVDAK